MSSIPLTYSLDTIYECSRAQNGYPSNSIYETQVFRPNPNNFDKCLKSTAPYNPNYSVSCSIGNLKVSKNNRQNFRVRGNIIGATSGMVLKYWASAPNTCTYGVSGLGLPFPNEEIAYENTPNKGEIILDNNGKFEIYLVYPSGYYINQGEIYVSPHLNIMLCNKKPEIIKIQLPIEAPYRSLGFNLANNDKNFQPVPFKK